MAAMYPPGVERDEFGQLRRNGMMPDRYFPQYDASGRQISLMPGWLESTGPASPEFLTKMFGTDEENPYKTVSERLVSDTPQTVEDVLGLDQAPAPDLSSPGPNGDYSHLTVEDVLGLTGNEPPVESAAPQTHSFLDPYWSDPNFHQMPYNALTAALNGYLLGFGPRARATGKALRGQGYDLPGAKAEREQYNSENPLLGPGAELVGSALSTSSLINAGGKMIEPLLSHLGPLAGTALNSPKLWQRMLAGNVAATTMGALQTPLTGGDVVSNANAGGWTGLALPLAGQALKVGGLPFQIAARLGNPIAYALAGHYGLAAYRAAMNHLRLNWLLHPYQAPSLSGALPATVGAVERMKNKKAGSEQ